MARQLAATLGVELVRFDMSEYMERHTVSRLIGAPPGYVGFDQGGLLTDAIDKHPHTVLLLDEIEKAHPDLFNILLQIMDHGKLTDHNGKSVDFRNVILIMTTNAGATELARPAFGFTRTSARATTRRRSSGCSRRSSATGSMPPSASATSRPKSCARWWTSSSCNWRPSWPTARSTSSSPTRRPHFLADKGYDEQIGARPLARVIQEHVKKPLADEVLFGRLANGGTVRVTVEKDEDGEDRIGFAYLSRNEERALPRPVERKALPGRKPAPRKRRKKPEPA